MIDIQKGSVIKTQNGNNGKEVWSMVLGCMADHDTITALRLTADGSFQKIHALEVPIDEDIFGEGVKVYANIFSVLNLKVDWVTEVRAPLAANVYYGVLSSFINYLNGFCYKKDGMYEMVIPYLQNPIMPMLMGMVSIDEAKNIEENAKIKLATRIAEKEAKEHEKRLSRVKPRKVSNRNGANALTELQSMKVYSLETQERIDAIYRFFSEFLASGERLSVGSAYNVLFKGSNLRKMKSNSAMALTKDQFAMVLNSDVSTICNTFKCAPANGYILRKRTIAVFTGIDSKSISRPNNANDEYYALIKELKDKGFKKVDIIKYLVENCKVNSADAKFIYTAYLRRKSPTKPVGEQFYEDRILTVMKSAWISNSDQADFIIEFMANNTTIYDKVHDGSVIVSTGDDFRDGLIIAIMEKAINRWKWIHFLDKPEYLRIAKCFSEMTLGDIASHYDINFIKSLSPFYSSPVLLIKLYSYFVTISSEDKRKLQLIQYKQSNDVNSIYPLFRVMICSSANLVCKNVIRAIATRLGLDNIDNIITLISKKENRMFFNQLDEFDELRMLLNDDK